MPNKTKSRGGPKTNEGKAISSRNSTTHGLTSKRWISPEEQSLYDETVKEFMVDFDPQTHIEKVLVSKLAECRVRLMRIQSVENAMFDLASSEVGHLEESIKSLDNGSDRLTQAIGQACSIDWKFDTREFARKMVVLDEIDRQNIKDIVNWIFVEDHMPFIADYITNKCINENLNLQDFLTRETEQPTHRIIRVVTKEENTSNGNTTLSFEEFMESANEVLPSSLQDYLDKLAFSLAQDLQVQLILKDLEGRTQQIKDAALPDTNKLSLIQRYRTADERQFSKTLGELLELQKRRNNI